MKKISKSLKLIILSSLISIEVFAQNQIEKCGSSIVHNQMMNDPAYVQKMNEFELFVKTQHNDPTPKIAAQYRIPVVVHVLHKGESIGVGTNVSDAVIREAIKELNNRYRKTAGTAGAGNGVDMEIEFALAVRNPSGQCTNGINRVSMTGNATYMASGVRSSSTNGITDAQLKAVASWDRTKYYNIYLVSEIDNNEGGAGVQGYAYFASSHGTSVDGAVVLANNFTSGGSMTTTHEMGHALNLYHTFEGDGSGANCPTQTNGCGSNAGDCCADTPPHRRSQSDCNTTGTNSCNANSSNSLFVRNYMDYSSDACMNMFTANQKTRALAACAQDRASFFAATNLALTPVAAPVADFSASSALVCSGQSVTFTDLSACVPNTYLPETNWTNMTFSWTFTNGSTVLTSTVQNPTMTFTVAGAYDVSLTVTTSFGTNTITKPAYVVLVGSPINACTPNSTNSGNTGQTVSKVVFNTISNTTDTYTNVAYSNFMCSKNTIVEPGITYPLSITANAGPTSAERFEVYIDYNNNGTFENPAELVHSGSVATGTQSALNTQTLSANVTIPTTAIQNTFLRMRVMADAATISSQKRICTAAFFIGDVEDYGIYINGVPTAPIANFTATPTNVCIGQNVQFTSTSSGNPVSYSWSFQGGTPATSSAQNPIVSFNTAGTYDVSLTVTNANGNNTATQTGYITVTGASTNTLPFIEGFTATAFPPTTPPNWEIINTDGGTTTWSRNATIGVTPTAGNSMMFDNFNFNDSGNSDEMRLPKLNFSSYSAAQMTFHVAYAPFTQNGQIFADGLKVLVSTDCGTNWNTVYDKSGNSVAAGNLPTINPIQGEFTPTSAQWRQETVDLTGLVGQSNVIIAFKNIAAYGNRLFIDNINITGTVVTTAPTASFTSTPATSSCTGQTVQYTSTSTGNPTTYLWNFAGGTPATSNAQNPTVTYAASGTYDVSLEVTNSLGSNTSNQTNYIIINQTPSITGTTPASRCGVGTVSLAATASTGSISWFSAATGGTALGTGVTFTTPSISTNTTYYVEVTSNGCTSARTAVLATVTNPTVTNPGSQTVCLGSSSNAINFTGSSGNTTYNWSNSNTAIGLGASGTGNISAFTPSATGTATVSVTPSLNGCTGNPVSFTINVNPLPTVTFDLSSISPPCVSDAAFALPAGSPTGGTYSGPGVSGTNFNPANAGAGTHTITYSVTQNGCTGSSNSTITVDACSGLEDTENMPIIIYPNPTNGLLKIEGMSSDMKTIELIDATGRVASKWNVNGNSMQLDLSKFATGNYNLKISSIEKVILKKIQIKK
jgi:PKD repeat protein